MSSSLKFAFVLTMALAANAQSPASDSIVVQGSIRTRMEVWDWFKGDGNNAYAFSGNILRLSLSQSKETFDWQVELAAPFLLGLPAGAVAAGTQGQLGLGASYSAANGGAQNSAMVFPKQVFVRFKTLGGNKAHSLKLGRFEYSDGAEMIPKSATLASIKRDRINQRLIGSFGWAHVGRSFDGVHYAWNTPSGNFTFMSAVPTRGGFQTDGWGWTNTALGYAAYTKPWSAGKHSAETRILGLYYQDWRSVVKTDSRPLAVRREDLATLEFPPADAELIRMLKQA